MKLRPSRATTKSNVFLSLVSDSGDLVPLYYIHTPGFFTRKTSTIYKFSPEEGRRFKGRQRLEKNELAGREPIAEIYWHKTTSSELAYNDELLVFDDFMPKSGFWRTTRRFQGPDGRTYSWKNSLTGCHLDLYNRGRSTPTVKVAEYKEGSIIIGREACLEVLPEGEHMVDLIIITWFYYETRRRDSVGSSNVNAGYMTSTGSAAAAAC